jgi:hypothetical protein
VPVVAAAPVEPPCTPDLSSFSDSCTSSGTASLVHTLFNLDPDEQGSSELVCDYTGTSQLEMDGGMWQLLYTGQNWHVQDGLAFACGGDTSSGTVIAAGTYTLDPLEFSLDDNFVCAGDQFDFDGQVFSGVFNQFCSPQPSDVYTFAVTLGSGDESPSDDTATDDSADEAAGEASCIPTVSGLSPSQPGEVISPSVSYTTAAGEPISVIQDRWFLNGVNTPSVVWDGGPVTVELQYTCLDNSAGTRTFAIAAFESSADSSGGGGGFDAGVVGAIVAGLLIVAGAAWMAIRRGRTTPTSAPEEEPAMESVALPVQPAPIEPATASSDITPAPSTPAPQAPAPQVPQAPAPRAPAPQAPSPPPQPLPRPLTPAERARLEALRAEMQDEVNAERAAYLSAKSTRSTLVRLNKKNLMKFIMKQGLEVQKYVRADPVEVLMAMGEEVTPDSLKIMERIFEKHDTSRDTDIVVELKRQIDAKQAEMEQHIDNVRHLRHEIDKIDTTLAGQ